jgi:hypothetical protein
MMSDSWSQKPRLCAEVLQQVNVEVVVTTAVAVVVVVEV